MKYYKEKIVELLKDVKFIIPVIITAILSFGFVITHHSINIDTLSYDRYFNEGELIAQGRISATIINKIFNVMSFNPFFVDAIAVIFLIIGSILFCLLFGRVAKDKFKNVVYTIFSCMFISYPLICEIFTYMPAGLSVGIGYCLVALSLMIVYESCFLEYNKFKTIVINTILLCLAVYLYESFAAVYLCGIFAIIIIEFVCNKNKIKLFELIKFVFFMIVPLILGIVLGFVAAKVLMIKFNLNKSINAQKTITYLSHGIIGGIRNLIKTCIDAYLINAKIYFPITMLIVSLVIYMLFMVKSSIKNKSFILFLVFIGFGIAVMSLSIIQGMAAPYRTCQTFAFFVAFVFMIITHDIVLNIKIDFLKKILLAIIFTIIFYQAKDLHKWFYVNHQRYEIEKNNVIAIGNELRTNFDIDKPVYFVGKIGLPSIIKEKTYVNNVKCGQTNVNLYINWAVNAFSKTDKLSSIELIKFFNYFGYDIKAGSRDRYDEVVKLKEGKPHWPSKGSIFETEDYIVVNF